VYLSLDNPVGTTLKYLKAVTLLQSAAALEKSGGV
jgi:hypothetical protein